MPLQDILARHRDLKETTYYHVILVKGTGYEACKKKVLSFFDQYQLVRYSDIKVRKNESVSASNPEFAKKLRKGILKNRRILNTLVKELQGEGVNTLNDLNELRQGYKTKMLHVITHFLDGFFGIDTYFYNLGEDSHWVSEKFREKISEQPSGFWLIYLEASI